MSRPRPFSDSFSTHEATFSVEVARPSGQQIESVIVTIDCNGTVSFDECAVDLVTEMLQSARDNLCARRGPPEE